MVARPPNSSVLLEQVSYHLKEAQHFAGLDKAEALVKELDDIKAKAEDGPGGLLDAVKAAFKSFMDTIDDAVRDPASLLGGGGILSVCSSYYGSVVLSKLNNLKAEAEKLFTMIAYLAATVAEPFGELGRGLREVMGVLSNQMSGLMLLPQRVGGLAAKVKSPSDFSRLDVSDLKKALDLSSLAAVLDKLKGLKSSFGPTMQAVTKTLHALAAFIDEAPGKVQHAFEVPLLGGCTAGGPAPMQAILQELEVLKRLDHQPLLETLAKTKQAINEMDVELVRKPMEAFSRSAMDHLNKLEGAAKGAKAAHEAAGAGAAAGTILGAGPAAGTPGAPAKVLANNKIGCNFWGK